MKKLKVAVVGCGSICNHAHLRYYGSTLKDLVELVAAADINIERAKAAAEEYNIPHYYASVEEMLACEPEIDYVDICVWTSAHAPVAIACAKAGKNILCEKPLAATLEQGLAIEKAVKEAGVTFMLAVCTRYGNEQQKFIEMRDAGEFGDIYYAKTAYVRRRGVPGGWFTNKEIAGGGPVLDIGVHAIDRTWYLMGRPTPVSVSAEASYRIGRYTTENDFHWNGAGEDVVFNVEDSATAYIRFEGGKSMFAEVSWTINGQTSYGTWLYGTKAGATFEPFTVYGENGEGKTCDTKYEIEENNIYESEIRHFIDCLHTGKKPISPIEDAVTIERILDAIYRSAEQHREVTL